MRPFPGITRPLFLFLTFLQLPAVSRQFSPFNRYDLSFGLLEERKQAMTDTSPAPWLSLYDLSISGDSASGILFSTQRQSINLDFAGLAGLEYYSKSSRFGAFCGDVDYVSPYLSARVSFDLYTTERRARSPVSDIQFERFIKEGANVPITGIFDFRANFSEAYLETGYKALTVSIGKQKLRWGPGYKGTLGLSGTAYSPFYFYHLNLAFGTLFNMKAFLCGYDDESIYRRELSISEKITVTENKVNLKTFLPRYGAGQRLDIRIGSHVQIGVYELVDFFGSNELNRFANPLQFYYLANEASGTNNANLLGGADFNLVFKPFRFYGEFLNDDITVFEQTGNPDKYAFQLGAAFYGNDPLIQTGVEYTHIQRFLYGHSRVLSRHAHWGESLGWPWGNFQDVFTAYALLSLPKHIYGKIEGNLWIRGNGAIEDDWYADGKPDLDRAPFWPRNGTTLFSAVVSVQHTPLSWVTWSMTWEPVVTKGTLDNGVYAYLLVKVPGKHVFSVK